MCIIRFYCLTIKSNENGLTLQLKSALFFMHSQNFYRIVFPHPPLQIYVVHQIRNSCKYIIYKDKKSVQRDMKNIIMPQ